MGEHSPLQSDEDDTIGKQSLCANCVGEAYLKDLIAKTGIVHSCDFCGKKGKSFSLEQVAEQIETAFENHYRQTSENPSGDDEISCSGTFGFERSGDHIIDAIEEATKIDTKPARLIHKILEDRNEDRGLSKIGEESPFAADSYYELAGVSDDYQIATEWDRFERTLKSEARFFSRSTAATLAKLFDGVGEYQTHAGRSVVRLAGPETTLSSIYRARVLQDREKLEVALQRPDLEVGPPASRHARAGRMNARGVPVFYGATEWEIALAEVRPPVGSDVVVAKFEIIRPLRLLDVAELANVFVAGSIFDPKFADASRNARFLGKLSRRIIAPVMPDMEEFEYLVTQAMAEYLADQPDLNLDGIIFPSAQRRSKGSNIVLFHKAARLELLDIPEGTEIFTFHHGPHFEDDDELPEWQVTEEVPIEPSTQKKPAKLMWAGLEIEPCSEDEDDKRVAALRVDTGSVTVRHIDGVSFRTTATPVSRRRRKQHADDEQDF